jgi:DnaJ-class molecular chaperone
VNDPYQVLGLARGADEAEVAAAYKKLAMQHHPDRNAGDAAAEARFKDINAARDAIKQGTTDPPNPFHPGGGAPGSPFWNVAGGQSFGNLDDILSALHAQQHQRNRDINVECTLSLEDVFRGTDVAVALRGPQETRNITVNIPAGVDHGNRVRVPQAGEHIFPRCNRAIFLSMCRSGRTRGSSARARACTRGSR